jgi:membrane associated rhomboid family serine protease
MTPPITKNLMIINCILFMAMMVGERWNFDLNQLLGLHFVLASNFQPFQLLTYMFMHANITHIFFNMFSLWMFGRIIESVLGGKRFLIFYLLCGIIAGISQEIVQLISYYAQGLNNYEMVNLGTHSMPMSQFLSTWTTIGASGCVYGVLVAYGMLFPNERVLLLIPPIPMKAKYMIAGFIALELIVALGASGDSVAHFAHLGGAAAGWLLIRRYKKKEQERYSGFTTWEEYEPEKKSFKQKVHDFFSKEERPETEKPQDKPEEVSPEELNHILEKIKRSGYESLTAEEKEKLFRR